MHSYQEVACISVTSDDTAVYRKHTSWRAYDTQQYQLGAVEVCI